MASVYYGVNLGQHDADVAIGTSTNSTDVELRVDTSKITTREQVNELVATLHAQVLKQAFPYA